MTYGDQPIRTSVPLALALLSASNPQMGILDTLSKYSHDSDLQVAQNAILAMGIVGAGTNNARLAQMLRGLSSYYAKEAETLFMVRIAQVSRVYYLEQGGSWRHIEVEERSRRNGIRATAQACEIVADRGAKNLAASLTIYADLAGLGTYG